MKICKEHGADHRDNKTGRCKKCRGLAVQRRRWKLKRLAVEYKGGKCVECGFIGHPACYDFHHKDPEQKDFGIAQKGRTFSWEKVKQELDKCEILCANCHRTKHVNDKYII